MCFEVGQEIGTKGADQRHRVARFHSELVQDGFGVGDFLVPLRGRIGAKFENCEAVLGVDLEVATSGVNVGDGVEWNFEASVTAEEDFGGFEEGCTGEGFSGVPESASEFVAHEGIKVTQAAWEGKSFVEEMDVTTARRGLS